MEQILQFIYEYKEPIFVIILSVFLGIEVISHVPAVLHTPLMSGANAIHGVVIIGAIIVMGKAQSDNYPALILGFAGCNSAEIHRGVSILATALRSRS